MWNNISNLRAIIAGRRVKKQLANKDLIIVGIKDDSYDGGYSDGAIAVEDLASSLGGDRLVAGTKEVVLTDDAGDATLTFSSGDAVIQTTSSGADLFIRTLTGDDIILESGDDIRLQGDKGLYDDEAEGGDINIYAGDGSDGNTANAGSGGDIRIEAGDAGVSTSGTNAIGGEVRITGGFTTDLINQGGSVYIYAGFSAGSLYGEVSIGYNNPWFFSQNYFALKWPVVQFSDLPAPGAIIGAGSLSGGRAFINDSILPAAGNFGAVVAIGGGTFVVPVFSDGVNWLIG